MRAKRHDTYAHTYVGTYGATGMGDGAGGGRPKQLAAAQAIGATGRRRAQAGQSLTHVTGIGTYLSRTLTVTHPITHSSQVTHSSHCVAVARQAEIAGRTHAV